MMSLSAIHVKPARYLIRVLVVISLVLPLSLLGQYSETITTDRPGQAIGQHGVGKKVVQVQTGINTNWTRFNEDLSKKALQSNTVIRLGLFEGLEVNGMINYMDEKLNGFDLDHHAAGISSTEFGTRFNILENRWAVPAVGIQASLLTRLQGEEFKRDKPGTRLMASTGNVLTDWLALTTNLGVEWDGNGNGARSIFVLNLGVSVTDHVGAFVETFGSFNDIDVNFDGGISYLIGRNVLLDVSAGWLGYPPLPDGADDSRGSDWFIDGGLSFRLDWRD